MRDDMTALSVTPWHLAELLKEVDDQALDRGADGEWSARTVLAHFRDEESLVFRHRLERMLSEDVPTFAPYPPERWIEERDTSRDGMRDLLHDFALQRKASVILLECMKPEHAGRKGNHPERGEFTVQSWVEYWRKHDEEHVQQIERALGRQRPA